MVPNGVWILTRLLSPRLYLPRVFPITMEPVSENSQTLAFGSPPDICHLPTISGEELPQPAIANSKTVMVVITNWNLYRAKLNGMTAGFLNGASAIGRMRDQATRCNPVKSVFGVTPRRGLIYRLPGRREAKAAVLSRRVDCRSSRLLPVDCFICKDPRNCVAQSLFGPWVIHSRETRKHSAGVASHND